MRRLVINHMHDVELSASHVLEKEELLDSFESPWWL
jgi:hypothetical protein